MKRPARILLSVILAAVFSFSSALAAPSPTPTPPPIEITNTVAEPPEIIRKVIDIAMNEWSTLNGKTLPQCNKYTEWRGKGVKFGWCGGFVTWCMLEAGVPMERLETLKQNGEGPVPGIMHVKEASVGKLLRGYQVIHRTTMMPQKGYLLVYGVRKSANRTVHIGLVVDVVPLGGSRFRITTIEGNLANRVKMYIHDYDMNAEDPTNNLSVVPAEERDREESAAFGWKMQDDRWYVNRFLMPWIPDDDASQSDESSSQADSAGARSYILPDESDALPPESDASV